MKVTVETIPHSSQRYDTIGDWITKRDAEGKIEELSIKVSESGNPYLNLALIVHELVEAVLTADAGVTDKEVDEWDCAHPAADDPGSIPGCPYGGWHARAEAVEHMIVGMIGLSWREYEDRLFAGITANDSKEP